MKLCLVRHGETAWSLGGQHTGVTDLGLTAHGEEESRFLAPRLRSLAFAQVLVSPRLRARQTCELAGLGVWAAGIFQNDGLISELPESRRSDFLERAKG